MSNIISMDGNSVLDVPDCVEIPFIEGDGIGPDIWQAAQPVFDTAVQHAYNGQKKIQWLNVPAGARGFKETGEWLSSKALKTIEDHRVAIKGPLATPVGSGMRSLNVKIRQHLDLYACIRPVRYYAPIQSPVKHPEHVNITVFRENTEDLYAGIEWDSGSSEAGKILDFMNKELDVDLCPTSAIGIKPICPEKTKRLVKKAVAYAVDNGLKSVTLMHKGNIMKFTEGGFRRWGYEVAQASFPDLVVTEEALFKKHNGILPRGKVLIRDRIADMVFAEVLLRPREFDVIAATNLNGDYISDALAAQVGGLGIAPGANVGDRCAVFEATHGTAPDLAGQDVANPCSIILSGAMMLDHMGWNRAADLVRRSVADALGSGKATADLASGMAGCKEVRCSEFGRIVCATISRIAMS